MERGPTRGNILIVSWTLAGSGGRAHSLVHLWECLLISQCTWRQAREPFSVCCSPCAHALPVMFCPAVSHRAEYSASLLLSCMLAGSRHSASTALSGHQSKIQGVRWALVSAWTRGDRPCRRVCPIYMLRFLLHDTAQLEEGQEGIQLRDYLLYSLGSRCEYRWQTFSWLHVSESIAYDTKEDKFKRCYTICSVPLFAPFISHP